MQLQLIHSVVFLTFIWDFMHLKNPKQNQLLPHEIMKTFMTIFKWKQESYLLVISLTLSTDNLTRKDI